MIYEILKIVYEIGILIGYDITLYWIIQLEIGGGKHN